MTAWLLVIILAYLLFGLSSFEDKVVLSRSKNPKLYVFYVGILSSSILLLALIFGISIPSVSGLWWIILSSLVFMSGLYALYFVVEKFEVSRVIPVVGAIQPVFTLLLSWIFFGSLGLKQDHFLAFFILLVASIIISFEKKIKITGGLLKLSLIPSLLITLGFIFTKLVFLSETFFNGIIWIGIFNSLFALILLFDHRVRKEVFTKKSSFNKKTLLFVLVAQSLGGLAGILQNFAIYLAPAADLAIINSLRGIQYFFLFIIALISSYLSPSILKEKITLKIITQKIFAIILILIGLYILLR